MVYTQERSSEFVKNYNKFNLQELLNKAGDNLSVIFDKYNLNLRDKGKYYVGKCVIHGGDNPTAFNIYKKGEATSCNWKCWTHHCETNTGGTLFDLVVQLEDIINNKKISKGQAIKLVADLYGIQENSNYVLPNDSKRNFIYQFAEKIETNHRPKISRQTVRQSLEIPSQYFLQRGFTEAILREKDIGDCHTKGKELNGRAVVPIYDENFEYIGCTARSIYEKCHICNYYHGIGECLPYPKWKNTEFDKTSVLYNLPWAKESITNKEFVFIVESPGNIWRLEEAGFNNCLALLGCEISDFQIEKLLQIGAYHLVLLMDKDENLAGQSGQDRIVEKTKRLFKISAPEFAENDIGCMSIERVKQLLGGYVNG